MKITIRVEITTDWDETDPFEICQLERPYRQLEPEKIGLSLAEGKDGIGVTTPRFLTLRFARRFYCDSKANKSDNTIAL
jgi:hypothetical protein